MPELKHTFTGGKMEKDKDERIVPNGQYRDALNISVSTSEDSDVGAAQNILGNIKVTQAIQGRTLDPDGMVNGEYSGTNSNSHVAEIVDPKTDMLYRFINTASPVEGVWMDRIVEYDTTKSLDVNWQLKEAAVMVDIYKVTANITSSQLVCANGNVSTMQVNKNLNQLRWGMRVEFSGATPDLTIEDINYVTGTITLNQAVTPSTPIAATFYGDRNLNFSPSRIVTGLNILDGVIFWTDNHSEPKKIEIKRGKMGSNTSFWMNNPPVPAGLQGRYSPGIPKIDDFNQHTILVVDDKPQFDYYKDESICPILGCTNMLAFNYDPNATLDDGSCCIDSGCMDVTAANYNFEACFDDGSCCYVAGCTDPDYVEFDPTACFDDGSCNTLITFGCIQGYQADSCGDKNDMIQIVSDNIFDVNNSFELMGANGLYDQDGAMDNVFEWFSVNNPSGSIMQRWYMAHCSGCNLGAGWQTDNQCSWQGLEGALPGVQYSLLKQKVLAWKFSDPVIRDPQATAVLGNPSGVSAAADVCFSQAGCNAYSLFDTIDDIITFLRNHSIFDGTFNYYDANDNSTPVPEITLGMSWFNILTISEQTYPFFASGQDGALHNGVWQINPTNCVCSEYVGIPTCMTTTDPNDSITYSLYPDASVCGDYCPPVNYVDPTDLTSGQGPINPNLQGGQGQQGGQGGQGYYGGGGGYYGGDGNDDGFGPG